MSDPLSPLRAGQKLTGIPAEGWNAFVEAAQRDRASRPRAQHGSLQDIPQTPILVTVQNKTGEAVDRFGILALGDPIVTVDDNEEAFKNRPAFEADTPTGPESGEVIVVLQDALPDDRIGLAVLLGVTAVRVEATTETDANPEHYCFAKVQSDNSETLLVASDGPARVLWREGGTEPQWALVAMLGIPSGSGDDFFPALITAKSKRDGCWRYSWSKRTFLEECGYGSPSPALGGTAGGSVKVETTTPGNDETQEVQTITVDATGGTFTWDFEDANGEDIPFDISGEDLQDLVDEDEDVVIVTGDGPYVITWVDPGNQPLTVVDGAGLLPKPVRPATELNNLELDAEDLPLTAWMKRGWTAELDFSVEQTVVGNGTSTFSEWEVAITNAGDGTYTLSLLGVAPDPAVETDPIAWNATAAEVEAAIEDAVGLPCVEVVDYDATEDDGHTITYTVRMTEHRIDEDDSYFALTGDGSELEPWEAYRFEHPGGIGNREGGSEGGGGGEDALTDTASITFVTELECDEEVGLTYETQTFTIAVVGGLVTVLTVED